MLNLVDGLSLTTGAALVAAASAGLAVPWLVLIRSLRARVALLALTPLVTAAGLYWLPVVLGDNAAEYRAWWGAFVVPWAAAGLLASIAMTIAHRLLATGRVDKHHRP